MSSAEERPTEPQLRDAVESVRDLETRLARDTRRIARRIRATEERSFERLRHWGIWSVTLAASAFALWIALRRRR